MNMLIPECLCGGKQFEELKRGGIDMRRCADCGILHQAVDTTPEELERWYRETYLKEVCTHTYSQDLAASKKRLAAYADKPHGRLLDIGTGNGAFLEAAVDAGIDAWGQELAECYPPHSAIKEREIYTKPLIDCHFPTGYFQTVTAHDVLEHVPDLKGMLKEIARITAPDGWFIVDFPDFSEKRHWKKTEHIWWLTIQEFGKYLWDAGIRASYKTQPVDGKWTFYCRPLPVKRPTVLLPPGIGDSYWSIVKLPGLMRQIGADVVDVYVADGGDGRHRSLEWLRKLPFINAVGYRKYPLSSPVFNEAYMTSGRYLFRDVAGCDYFLAFNGRMRFGADLEQIEPEWGTDWYPPLFQPLDEVKFEQDYRFLLADERFGYIVCYFVPHGMYQNWLKEMPHAQISATLQYVAEKTGCRLVFMGAEWDKDGMASQLAKETGGLDFVGKTTIPQMVALIRGSSGVIGWPAGNTILATMLKRPTLLYWNDYFDERFWRKSCPPDSWEEWYWAIDTKVAAERLNHPLGQWLDAITEQKKET
ncbi:MAG: methyltransferase domain-containing protein [Gammaproteobacteria bacterium]